MKKVFALVDCNSFYCSCERIFKPWLNNRPVIVLSNNDGCAIARTNEAKALGIKMGEPFFKIKQLCQKHKVSVFSANFSLYTNISERVMNILEKRSPEIEVYSIDEAFLDLSGISNLTDFGFSIRNELLNNVGIPTGVGIAPTKVLAKIANHIAKKSPKAKGVVNLTCERLQDVALARTAIEDVWGIGRASSEKLKILGIKTAYDFKYYQNEKYIQKVLTKVGLQIQKELKGINCFHLENDIEKKKEIMCSRSFGQAVCSKLELEKALFSYISDACEKMRKQGSLCTQLSIFARTNPFNLTEQHYIYEKINLTNPTLDTRKLLSIAKEMLNKSYKEGIEYKKAGAKLSNFYDSHNIQLDLLSPSDTSKTHNLMKTIDYINYREGSNAVTFGICSKENQSWEMNRNYLTQRYTTSWSELPCFGEKESENN